MLSCHKGTLLQRHQILIIGVTYETNGSMYKTLILVQIYNR